MTFDGSDVGVGKPRVDAAAWLDADSISGPVDDSDIVQFDFTSFGANTAGTFSLYFDGSDVGLTDPKADVTALEYLPDGGFLLAQRCRARRRRRGRQLGRGR